MKAILHIEKLKAYYDVKAFGVDRYVRAVNNVNFDVSEGEIFGIAGESGCGKSTLIKVLYALNKPPLTVMGGRVLYNTEGGDKNPLEIGSKELQKLRWNFVSYIPQGSMSVLNPTIRIKKQFLDVIKAHHKGTDAKEAIKLSEEHVSSLGLPREVMDSYPHQLSGGMKQRVTIALATILKPRIIFADEPTTALDVVVQRGVIQLLKHIQKELHNTVIIVTHDMGVHAEMADRIGIMYAGKIIEIAPTREIFKNALHPYTQYLIKSLPKVGDKTPKASAPGAPPSLDSLPNGCSFNPRCPYAKEDCYGSEPELRKIKAQHLVACCVAEEAKNGKN